MNAGQGREFRLSHLPCDLILAQKVPTLHLAPTDSVGGCGLVNSRQWFKFSFSSRCPLPSPQWGGNGYELLIIIGWVLNSELPMFSPVNTGGGGLVPVQCVWRTRHSTQPSVVLPVLRERGCLGSPLAFANGHGAWAASLVFGLHRLFTI